MRPRKTGGFFYAWMKGKEMFDPESYPRLYRPYGFCYRLAAALGELFAVRDFNQGKVQSVMTLALNLLGRVL